MRHRRTVAAAPPPPAIFQRNLLEHVRQLSEQFEGHAPGSPRLDRPDENPAEFHSQRLWPRRPPCPFHDWQSSPAEWRRSTAWDGGRACLHRLRTVPIGGHVHWLLRPRSYSRFGQGSRWIGSLGESQEGLEGVLAMNRFDGRSGCLSLAWRGSRQHSDVHDRFRDYDSKGWSGGAYPQFKQNKLRNEGSILQEE